MQVFYIAPRDSVQLLEVALEDDLRIFSPESPIGCGRRFEGTWSAPEAWKFKEPRKRRPDELADITQVLAAVSAPAFSAKARSVIEPFLGESAQWLPLQFAEREYWMLNLLRLVDMDMAHAVIDTLPGRTDGHVRTYAFREQDLQHELLFKARHGTARVLCTERFVDLVKHEKLTGFWFGLLWDSRYPAFTQYASQEVVRSRPEIYGPKGIWPSFEHHWPEEWRKAKVERRTVARG